MNFIYVGETIYDGRNISVVFLCDHIREVREKVITALDENAANNALGQMIKLEYLTDGQVIWGQIEQRETFLLGRKSLFTISRTSPVTAPTID